MRALLGSCLAIVLIAYLAVNAVLAFPYQAGADFYQFWGIGRARAAAPIAVSPYRDPSQYAQVLNAISDASADEKLHAANSYRRELETAGTPLLYAAFALLPADYGIAQALYVTLLYACALLALVLLARLLGFGLLACACIAPFIALTFTPFLVDIKAANVNSLQLAALAALLWVSYGRAGRSASIDGAVLGLLAVLVVFKPNIALIAVAYAAHYRVRIGREAFARSALVAIGIAFVALIASAAYFHDALVWSEWWRYARRMAGTDAMVSFERGNDSLGMWLAQHASWPPAAFGAILGGVLVVAFAAAATDAGRRTGIARETMRRAISDPFFAVSAGILLTFATTPLLWIHYFVLALVPMLWLLRGKGRAGTVGALVAFAVMSTPGIAALSALGEPWLFDAATLLAWTALVPGTVAFVARTRFAIS
jgi:hypothetical protein